LVHQLTAAHDLLHMIQKDRPMFKPLSALVLAATVAFTTVAPTQVNAASRDDQLAQILFGAAALAILAKTIDNKKKRERSRQTTHSSHSPHSQVITPRSNVITPAHPPVVQGTPQRTQKRHHIRSVTRNCQRTINTDKGQRHFFAVPCLNRAGHAQNLPQNCLRRLQLPNRTVNAYGRRCLTRSGVDIVG
jgi:hypothetical protein